MVFINKKILEQLRRVAYWIATLLYLGMATATQAEPQGQFYFIGKAAHDGATSSAGTNETAVYLRWDALEGKLPDAVRRIQLLRDGTPILEFAPDTIMSAAQIQQVYQGAAQEQRLLDTLSRLQEEAAINAETFDPQNYAEVVRNRLIAEPAWAYLASRNDFNLAMARLRAYRDYPGSGEFAYELLALDANDKTARLGFIRVNTARPQAIGQADAPRAFRAVRQASCHVPEYGKDHHTVALDWELPGQQITDRIAAQITTGGYDLYRGTSNLPASINTPPEKEIAKLARQSTHNAQGLPVLAGLEKVNEVPVMLTPSGDETPEYLETHDVLARAGLQPGDRRAYYLVARDFAGHYSATAATIVEVPDLVRPATPWNVWPYAGRVDDAEQIVLQWDAVNLDNYRRAYANTQQFCNLDQVTETGTLATVATEQNCAVDAQRKVKVDVDEYRIYRFNTFNAASRFKDSDGDGIADSDELGAQCNTAAAPSFAVLLNPDEVKLKTVTLGDGREVIQIQDALPAQNKGDVYWYRVAAKSASGQLSLLSEPVRGIYPDRELPPKPTPTIEITQEEPIGCELEVVDANAAWRFEDAIQLSNSIDLRCEKETNLYPDVPIADLAQPQGQQCLNNTFRTRCRSGVGRSLGYQQDNSRQGFSCTVNVDPTVPGFCEQGHVRLKLETQTVRQPIDAEQVAESFIITVPHPEPDTCVSLFNNMGGRYTRVATSCDDDSKTELEYAVEQGTFCGFAVAHDENNNISPPAFMPCVETADKEAPEQLAAPRPVSLELNDTQASIAWRQPIQAAASILIELSRTQPAAEKITEIITHPAMQLRDGETQSRIHTLPALVASSEEWCVRFKTIGQQQNASFWSATTCTQRDQNNSAEPAYLPWPPVPSAPRAEDLVARFAGDLLPQRTLATHLLIELSAPKDYSKECLLNDSQTVNNNTVNSVFAQVSCSQAGQLNANQPLADKLNFLVYRQSRNSDGQLSRFTQVSPLITFTHWDQLPSPVVLGSISISASANDPYVKLFRAELKPDAWQWAFVDQYPYLAGLEYRYQLVYLDQDGEISGWRQTNWVSTASATATAARFQ